MRRSAFSVAAVLMVVHFAAAGTASAYDAAPFASNGDWGPPAITIPGPTIVNGGFETGNFNGWIVANEKGGSGNWFVYSGDQSPINGFPVPPPPQGRFAAITDQTGAGSHLLLQDFVVPTGQRTLLSFIAYYDNFAGEFFTPNSLDASGAHGRNQQYRIDLMDPSALVQSVAPADIIETLFLTHPGDPTVMDPTPYSFDITRFAGQTVRLRFAEVDNQSFFLAAVDAVALSSGVDNAPVASTAGIIAVVLALVGVAAWSMMRRRPLPRN